MTTASTSVTIDRFALLDWLFLGCEPDRVALLYPKGDKGLSPGWVKNSEDAVRAIEAFRQDRLAQESFDSVTDKGVAYRIHGAVRLGLVPHREGKVRRFCIDLDDHNDDGGNVHLLDAICRFFGARPLIFTSMGGKGLHCFFELLEPMDAAVFVAWAKAWGFNRSGEPELFPKTVKNTQAWLPNEPNDAGGDTYRSGDFESCMVTTLPAAPSTKLTNATLHFLRGFVRQPGRNDALNKAAFELGRKRVPRDEAWRLCQFGAKLCGLHDEEPDQTQATFESGYAAGKAQQGSSGGTPAVEAVPIELEGPHGVLLRVVDVQRTNKKYTGRYEVLIDGVSTGLELTASDTAGGVRNATTSLLEMLNDANKALDDDGKKQLRTWLGRQLTRKTLSELHERLARLSAQAAVEQPDDRPSMQQITVRYMREYLDLRFVVAEPMTIWSERHGVMLRYGDFVNRVEPGLLEAMQGACDYAAPTPNDPTKPIKHAHQVLKPAWCEITNTLPREVNAADLGPDSKAAGRFRRAVIGLWLSPETWMKFDATKDTPSHTERMSLASRVRALIPEAIKRPDRWQRVLKGVNAFFRVRPSEDGRHEVWLGMRVDLVQGAIKGQIISGVQNQHDLAVLANRYGVADATGVPTFITDVQQRRRLVVLNRALCDLLLECEDAPEPPLRCDRRQRATEVFEGVRIDTQTGEVLDES